MFKFFEREKSLHLPKSLALLLSIATASFGTVVLPARSFAQSDATVYVEDVPLHKVEAAIAKGCKLKRSTFPEKTTANILQFPSPFTPMSSSHYQDLKKQWEKLPFCKIPAELPINPPFSLGNISMESDIRGKLRLIQQAGDACDEKALAAAKRALLDHPALSSPVQEVRDELYAWKEQVEEWIPDCIKARRANSAPATGLRQIGIATHEGGKPKKEIAPATLHRETLGFERSFFDGSIGIAGGVTTGHRDGSLNFIDVFSGEPASTGQSGSSTFGTFGVLGTVSTPIFLPGLPGSSGFFETGFLFNTGNQATATFAHFSGNEATGQTGAETLWSVPLLAGVQIPVGDFGIPAPNVALQLKGGGMIDRRKVTFSTFEVTPDFVTFDSATKTQINPAFGFGFIYAPPPSVSLFKFGVQTIFDFQQPISVTVQSTPFPSAFYMVNTGHQLNTTVVVTASAPITFATHFGLGF
jgi:hypothetical protein